MTETLIPTEHECVLGDRVACLEDEGFVIFCWCWAGGLLGRGGLISPAGRRTVR